MIRLLKEFYPQLEVRVFFKPCRKLHSLFKFKDVVPKELQSSVVYKYECHSCNAAYIGKTKRQFKARIYEHLGKSIRTNRWLSNPSFSAIREHAIKADHPIKMESFRVMASRRSDTELCILESLLLHQQKPKLCNYEKSYDLLCF